MAEGPSRYLAVYLNDHLAGATVGVELLERAVSQYDGTPLGAFLRDLRTEIVRDREALEAIMADHDVRPHRAKLAAAWLAEKAGRLKFNGALIRRSPLTPFVELETLAVGIHGKLLLWRALRAEAADAESAQRLDELIARAEGQHEAVERHRVEAGGRALSRVRAR